MKVRVRDIAKRAGVSPATVSNALNGRRGVSEANAKEILRLAQEMGYQVSKTAKQVEREYVRLVMFRRHGLVVMDTQFFTEVVESIDRECQAAGLELLITHIHLHDNDFQERVAALCAETCAGILLLGTEMYPQELALFTHCTSPLVVLDNLFRHEKVHAVVMNNYEAGFQATHALYAAGHRHIGHITSNVEFGNMRYRRKGYEAVMTAHALPISEENIWRLTPTLEGAYEDMRTLLASGRALPTAFFVGNDIMAVGCMRALAERGVKIPDDLSLIGMDDLSLCQISNPPLSTIRVYRQEMGTAAVRTLLTIGRTLGSCILKTELSVDLVERQSVKRLKGAKQVKAE